MKRASARYDETPDTLLRRAGLKVTAGRRAVLSTLMATDGPLCVNDLAKHPRIASNLVTLYRMLEQLVAAGILYQTNFRDGKAYFEYQRAHHHHIVCTSCGTREHIEAPCTDRLARDAARASKRFGRIDSHMLEFFGTCRQCERRN